MPLCHLIFKWHLHENTFLRNTVPESLHACSAKQQKSIFLCQIEKHAKIKSQLQQRPTMRTILPWNGKQVCTKVEESVSALSHPSPTVSSVLHCCHCDTLERKGFVLNSCFSFEINQQSFPAWLSTKSCRLTSSADNLYDPTLLKDKFWHHVCLIEAFSPICDICFGVCELQ